MVIRATRRFSPGFFKTLSIESRIEPASLQFCSQALYGYRMRFSQVNNSPRAHVFLAGEANFGQAMYRSLERSTLNTRDGFDLYSAQASFAWPRVDLVRLLRRAVSRPFCIISFEFVQVCGIRFSIWERFIGFYIWCYPISTILVCFCTVGVRISWKKLCWKASMAAKMESRASYLVYYYCIESEFEQIITKLYWGIKENNN